MLKKRVDNNNNNNNINNSNSNNQMSTNIYKYLADDDNESNFVKPTPRMKIRKPQNVIQIPEPEEIPEEIIPEDSTECEDSASMREEASKLLLKNRWKIYMHKTEAKEWGLESFDKLEIVESVGGFLDCFKNFKKFDGKQNNIYMMKSYGESFVEPIWEHEMNRTGGTCSIRLNAQNGTELMEQLCLLTVNEMLVPNMEVINGISYGIKTNWGLIKIWTNGKEDISKQMPTQVLSQYSNINVRYKVNEPEF